MDKPYIPLDHFLATLPDASVLFHALGPEISASTQGTDLILRPLNTRPRPFFWHVLGAPTSICSMPQGPKFCSASTWGTGRILVPPEYRTKAVFSGHPEDPASMLLYDSWPQILVCQHAGHGPDSQSP